MPDTSPLVPVLGQVTLVFCALVVYFLAAAYSLIDRAYGPADRAVVTALRVMAGACAIPALVFGLSFLNRRDEAIARATQAGQRRGADADAGALDHHVD